MTHVRELLGRTVKLCELIETVRQESVVVVHNFYGCK